MEYDCKDIIRLYEPDRLKISLDLLQNLSLYFKDIDDITNIYNNYVISDILETTGIVYQNMNEYLCALTIYNYYLLLQKNKCNHDSVNHNLVY